MKTMTMNVSPSLSSILALTLVALLSLFLCISCGGGGGGGSAGGGGQNNISSGSKRLNPSPALPIAPVIPINNQENEAAFVQVCADTKDPEVVRTVSLLKEKTKISEPAALFNHFETQTTIDLSDANLQNILPLKNLNNVKEVNLRGNNLTDEALAAAFN
ncbi:MAG: hypothetical protein HQK53_06620 [Oligoflexia bacterium]|nr:hypothetical protein [Oligoflexia bacterium]